MPRFSANISMMFTELPFEERFKAARRAGFDAVEFLFPYAFAAESLADVVRDTGLGLSVFNLPPGDWASGARGLAALSGREDEFAEGLERAARYAKGMGAQQLHCMAGIAQGKAAEACYIANLRRAADRLARQGCKVLIEPINRHDMPGYFLHRTDQALELLQRIDHENVALQWDIYHHERTHGDALTALAEVVPAAAHIQIAGVPERHEPLGFGALFEALDVAGYAGWVGCEYHPVGTTKEGLGWLGEARHAAKTRA
ncbi:TIM barrel protein [uncultured Lentibacter sp.]|uniref:hydroxypyruvate isomerase family protein n=1 Tax=uncultured Lentibacter sp. TaxID=1659309 RepID=UPI0026032A4E|nr:TIM barrel protein [uncultured Lentibacter sp.]